MKLALRGSILLAFLLAGSVRADDHVVQHQMGDDLFSAGEDVQVSGEVAGDAVATGGEVRLDANVAGDSIISGGELTIGGTTLEDLYAAGGEVEVGGKVGGNARVAGGDVEIARGASIDGGVSAAGAKVRVDGTVARYLQVAGGRIRIDGRIGGDVESAGGSLWIGPNAVIEGAVVHRGPKPPEVASGAQVSGKITHVPDKRARMGVRALVSTFSVLWLLGWMAAGALALALLPRITRSVTDAARQRTGASLLMGLIVLVLVPVVLTFLAVTIIGIPLSLMGIAIYLLLLALGGLAGVAAVGDWLLARFRSGAPAGTGLRVLVFLGVMLVVWLLGHIPFLGGLICLLLVLAGMGAIVYAFLDRSRTRTPPTAAAA